MYCSIAILAQNLRNLVYMLRRWVSEWVCFKLFEGNNSNTTTIFCCLRRKGRSSGLGLIWSFKFKRSIISVAVDRVTGLTKNPREKLARVLHYNQPTIDFSESLRFTAYFPDLLPNADVAGGSHVNSCKNKKLTLKIWIFPKLPCLDPFCRRIF